MNNKDELNAELRGIQKALDELEIERERGRIDFGRYLQLKEELETRKAKLEELVNLSANPSKIFISYKRKAKPDEQLALHLRRFLHAAGHTVFIDQKMPIGVDWATEIKRLIADSDCMIVLLSDASVNSEMVAQEIEYARERQIRLLPVRIAYTEALPYQLDPYLAPLHYAEWHNEADTPRLAQQLFDAIEDIQAWQLGKSQPTPVVPRKESGLPLPKPQADPRFINKLETPGGAIRPQSKFYVERWVDGRLYQEITKSIGTTTTIRGSRQTGKTSLLTRVIANAGHTNHNSVYLDLQQIDSSQFCSLETFFRYLAEFIAVELGLKSGKVASEWHGSSGPSYGIDRFLIEYVLPQVDAPIMLVLDEVERILQTSFHDDFFSLVRAWYNRRAWNTLWDKLSVIMVISTEPHLLIQDIHRSPFNVGLMLELEDFDEVQIQQLNAKYNSPVRPQHLRDFIELFGGHPYLTQQALYTLVMRNLSWTELVEISISDTGPFGAHLRRYLWLLQEQSALTQAIRDVIQHQRCPDEQLFIRLLRAGLIKGTGQDCTCRCKLYQVYLGSKLS